MELHFRYWPAATVQGIVVGLHGIQSHSGWYEHSSRVLSEAGFAVYFADRRGSGLNEPPRGHADHAARLINDTGQLIGLARRENPDVALTLIGLSWGGKLAAAMARTGQPAVDRLALLYPGLRPRIRPNVVQKFLLWFARTHDIRHRLVRIPLDDPALFTDDPTWQTLIREDNLALTQVTTGLLNSGIELDRIFTHGDTTLPPTLLMLAGRDRIIDNRKTRELLQSVPCQELTVCEYPNACHTLEFAAERDQVFADLIRWLESPKHE